VSRTVTDTALSEGPAGSIALCTPKDSKLMCTLMSTETQIQSTLAMMSLFQGEMKTELLRQSGQQTDNIQCNNDAT